MGGWEPAPSTVAEGQASGDLEIEGLSHRGEPLAQLRAPLLEHRHVDVRAVNLTAKRLHRRVVLALLLRAAQRWRLDHGGFLGLLLLLLLLPQRQKAGTPLRRENEAISCDLGRDLGVLARLARCGILAGGRLAAAGLQSTAAMVIFIRITLRCTRGRFVSILAL